MPNRTHVTKHTLKKYTVSFCVQYVKTTARFFNWQLNAHSINNISFCWPNGGRGQGNQGNFSCVFILYKKGS
jgi:hypothetical protein